MMHGPIYILFLCSLKNVYIYIYICIYCCPSHRPKLANNIKVGSGEEENLHAALPVSGGVIEFFS